MHEVSGTNIYENRIEDMKKRMEREAFSLLNDGVAGGILCCYNMPGFPLYYVNDGLLEYIGYTRNEFEEKYKNSGLGIVWHEDMQNVVEEVMAALREGREYNIRHRILAKDGRLRWMQAKGRRVADWQGREFVVNVSLEISDIIELQHELQEKERLLSAQNELLREQEEELAAQNEELAAQNEELSAQNEELTLQSGLLSEQNEELEAQKRQLEEQARQLAASEERFRLALEKTSNIIFDYDICTGKIVNFIRPGADIEFLAASGEMPDSRYAGRQVAAGHTEEFQRIFREIRNGAKQTECEVRVFLKDGREAWYRISLTGIADERGIPVRAVGMMEDVTRFREMERAFAQEEQYRKAIFSDALAFYEINLTQDRIEKYQVKSSSCLLPDTEDSYSGIIAKIAESRCLSQDRAAYGRLFSRENMLRKFAEGKSEFSAEYRVKTDAGGVVWLRAVMRLVRDSLYGDIKGFFYMADIDSRKKRELELIRRSERDSMTGVYNKNTVINRIRRALNTEEGMRLGTFYLLDVDYFKEVNDTFGHPFGDRVLVSIAEILKKHFRGETVGRIGGDEFCVFRLEQDSDCAEKDAEEICTLVRKISLSEKGRGISCSIGIAECAGEKKSFEQIYREADEALYRMKQAGRNGYNFYGAKARAENIKK